MSDEEIRKFAERVERLCEYLLDRMARDGTDDHRAIDDLRQDASLLHDYEGPPLALEGIAGVIR